LLYRTGSEFFTSSCRAIRLGINRDNFMLVAINQRSKMSGGKIWSAGEDNLHAK
jgi:hypothetical protein